MIVFIDWFYWFDPFYIYLLCFFVFLRLCVCSSCPVQFKKNSHFFVALQIYFWPAPHSLMVPDLPARNLYAVSPDFIFSSTLDCHEGVFSFVKYGLQVTSPRFFYSTEIHKKLKPPVFILYEADIICVLSPLFVKQAIFLLVLLPSSLSGLFDLSSSLVFKTPIKVLPAVRVNLPWKAWFNKILIQGDPSI